VVQSPYIAQVQLLRDRLQEYPVAAGVEVSTIDSFQGREADKVVISMVRFWCFFSLQIRLPNLLKTKRLGCCC
jgi:hypothetical protein